MVLSEEEKAERPFNVEEVAEFFRVHPKTISKWLADGKIKGAKVGREWRIPRSEIKRILKEEQ